MPEGDTVRLAAERLAPILAGRRVEEFWARKLRGHRPRAGQTIEAVRTHGKHLLVDFDRRLTLDVHLGMSGSWRTLHADDDPAPVVRDPRARLWIATSVGHAICFAAPTIQTFLRDGSATPLDRLGPDLLDPTVDLDEVVQRARTLLDPATYLADLLMDQRIAAGIGNAIKSEVLHLARQHPFASLGSLTDAGLRRIYAIAADLLGRSVASGSGRRSTTPGGRLLVYRRHRRPCRQCGTLVHRSYDGAQSRSTYWCPTCQESPEGDRDGADTSATVPRGHGA